MPDDTYITRDGSNLSFILNPRSRHYSRGFRKFAAAKWPRANFFFASGEKELREAAGKAAGGRGDPVPVVVACGGDGTFRTVATAVAGKAITGIIPMGTANLVAYQLGIPMGIRAAVDFLETAHPMNIYPGCCSLDESDVSRLFFLSVSIGPDAEAVHYVSKRLKMLFGGVAYAASFLERLFFHPLPEVTCILDGKPFASSGIIAVSSECYGSRNPHVTRQSLYRPGIGILSLQPGRWRILAFFLALFFRVGRPADHASMLDGTTLEILCPPHGRFQIDGDRLSATKIYIRPMDIPLPVLAGRAGPHP